MCVPIRILELCADYYLSVELVLVVEEVSITGSDYRLIVLFTEGDYASVKISERFVIRNLMLVHQKSIVGKRLYFKIIVKVYYILDLRFGLALKYRREELSRLAGRAYYKSLSVLFKLGLGDSRHLSEIIQITV